MALLKGRLFAGALGAITTKQASIGDSDVSTYYHHVAIGTVHTAQEQVSIGSVSTSNNIVETHANNKVIVHAATYQQQVSFGKVTTDDDEMLMVLMALMALDDEVA